MEKNFQNKPKVHKNKDKKSLKIDTFARDFKMYSRISKPSQHKEEGKKNNVECKHLIFLKYFIIWTVSNWLWLFF